MPETRQPADDWALLLEQAFRDHDAARQGHDLRPYFRAQAFREHHNESEIRLRAHAFRQTLVRLPLTVRRGDCFIGSPASFYVDPLPRDISEADLRLARDVCGWHAPREHGVGFDAVLPDYPTLLALGLGGMGHRLADAVRHLDPDTAANDVAEAMQTVLTGLGAFAHRCADTCREVGREEDARLLAHIAELPPRSMREALQLVWLVHLALLAEGRTAPALGRMDRWLEPFYLRDMERGDLDREAALDLLCHFFVRFAEAPPGAWITLGGPRPAGEAAPGETATLLLDALALAPAPGLRVAVRMAAAAPETLLRPILELLEVDGPAITLVNDDVLAAELTQAGLGAEAAEDYAVLDAIAPAVPGRHPVWAAHRLDLRNPIGAGIAAWRDDAARSWASLREQLETTLRTAVDGEAKRLRKRFAPAAARTHRDPVHAALLADCVDRLCDANAEEAPLLRLVGVSAPDLLPVADAVATLAAQVCEGGATQPETLLDTAADGFGEDKVFGSLVEAEPRCRDGAIPALAVAHWLTDRICRLLAEASREDAYRVLFLPGRGPDASAEPDGVQDAPWPLASVAQAFDRITDRAGPLPCAIPVAFSPTAFAGAEGLHRFALLARGLGPTGVRALTFA